MDRSPPADLSAERATLGAMLLDRDAIIAVAPWLPAEAFYLEKHAWIYDAMLACYHQRVPPDLATVADALRRQERLDAVGGLTYLGELSADVPTAVHVEYYARIVERTAIRRRLITAGGTISGLGYADETDLAETLDQAEAELFRVTQRATTTDATPVATLSDTYFERLRRIQDGEAVPDGLATGFADLDGLLLGLHPSDMIIVAGRPSQGKTAFALSLMRQIAQAGHHVLLFSLEMSGPQIHDRLLAMETGLSTQMIRQGRMAARDLERVLTALGRIATWPLQVDDTPGLQTLDLRSRARRIHAQRPLDLVVIDYLQLLGDARGARENRVQEVSAISRGVKQLARELHVPVIALSQLSRAVESRASHVPLLSDLRESGSLEQDCDVCGFVYREEVYDKATTKPGIAEIHIAKHRNGPLGIVPFRFDAQTTRFLPLAAYHAPERSS